MQGMIYESPNVFVSLIKKVMMPRERLMDFGKKKKELETTLKKLKVYDFERTFDRE